MYWELTEAREELIARQRNIHLVNRVNEFLGNCPIPTGCQGFLARHIASARLEDVQFEERCQQVGLKPVYLTYHRDIFVSNNPSKVRLVQLFIFNGYGRKSGPRIRKINLYRDIKKINRISFSQIETKWGELLIQFHHRTRRMVGLKGEIIDLSEWLQSIGQARQYYKYLLAAYVTKGILFESFESPGFPDLDIFTQTIVLPGWRWVKAKFGCLPLIVRHPEGADPEEEKRILNWYPSVVLEAIPKGFV